jgi:hypothetical protein
MNAPRPISPAQLAALLGSDECPRPERLLEAVAGELAAPERDAVLRHAAGCDACGAELALARAFADPSATVGQDERESAALASDVDWVVAQLEGRRQAAAPELARVLPMSARRAGGARGGWLAAAASLALAVGGLYLVTRTVGPPPVPGPPPTDVLRGGEIAWETPLGRLAALPAELAWSAVPGAVRYRVTAVEAASRAPLWSVERATPRLALSPELRQPIVPLTAVELRVEALAPDGARLATSPPAELRLER